MRSALERCAVAKAGLNGGGLWLRAALAKASAAWRRVWTAPAICKGFAFGAVALAFIALGAEAARSMADATRPQAQAVALPAAHPPSVSWSARRAAFAKRKRLAWSIEEDVAEEFAGWILEAATRQLLPPDLLASLVLAESSFRKNARSSVGAFGPAQVRMEYWGAFCGANLTDPAENIYCGAQILAAFLQACGDMECALRSYNVGPRNAQRGGWAGRAGSRYMAKIEDGVAQLQGVAAFEEAVP